MLETLPALHLFLLLWPFAALDNENLKSSLCKQECDDEADWSLTMNNISENSATAACAVF